jgi:hypothetical protein
MARDWLFRWSAGGIDVIVRLMRPKGANSGTSVLSP